MMDEEDTIYISEYQRDILKQFRKDLKDYLTPAHTDRELLKWLRARNFNLKKAEDNFREVFWNRITYEINTMPESFVLPEVLQKYRGDTFLGFAKDGSPVRYIKLAIDYRGFLQSISSDRLILFFCYILEIDHKAKEEGYKKTGKKSDGIVYIVDLEGVTIQHISSKVVIETGLDSLRLYQDHYPESWKVILMVNAPAIFGTILNMFKPILKDTLLGRFKAASKESTPEFLLQYIDKETLPKFLGGNRTDSKGDPYCKEFINQAGVIPEKFYLKNSRHYMIQENDPDVSVVTIGARSVYNLPIILRKGPAKYKVQLRTEGGAIFLTVLYREFGKNPDDLDIPASDEYLDPHDERCNVKMIGTRLRCQTHIAPIDGSGLALNPGIYILQFDNKDSWFTSKKLYYRITCNALDSLPKYKHDKTLYPWLV